MINFLTGDFLLGLFIFMLIVFSFSAFHNVLECRTEYKPYENAGLIFCSAFSLFAAFYCFYWWF